MHLAAEVALRKESVDRNTVRLTHVFAKFVALRKESVDRNNTDRYGLVYDRVALRKESVDRNLLLRYIYNRATNCRSPQGERG